MDVNKMMLSTFHETTEQCTFIGTFDAENFWRNQDKAKLPAMNDEQTVNIVLAMDELQFLFCKQKDTLITRYGMDAAHLDYLKSIGFSFSNNNKDVVDRNSEDILSKSKSIIQLLAEADNMTYFNELIKRNSILSPFAVVPFTEELSNTYHTMLKASDIEVIKRVNSKLYSTKLCESFGLNKGSVCIKTCEELLEIGTQYLAKGPVIIKDECGVSGKGNQLIKDHNILRRITSYLSAQERRGKKVSFIIEPYLQKKLDFSSHFYISDSGKFHLMSVQKLLNSEFSYLGSFSVEDGFLKLLEEKGYFDVLQKASKALYQDGYRGHVCIDSMILKDEKIYPIVEINARKSMNLLKHHLDQFLKLFTLKGSFSFLSTSFRGQMRFEELLKNMRDEGILFEMDNLQGIIPLSANALYINRDIDSDYSDQKVYKGRLYFAAVAQNSQSMIEVTQRLKDLLIHLEYRVFN